MAEQAVPTNSSDAPVIDAAMVDAAVSDATASVAAMADAAMNDAAAVNTSVDDEVDKEDEHVNILAVVRFANVRPFDIPRCLEIEKESYPKVEAASKRSLQYRQHHAAPYFRCAYVTESTDEAGMHHVDDEDQEMIGFICATRCHDHIHESMSTHHSEGPLLAIHSVVVEEEYRRQGVATAMLKDYVEAMRNMPEDGVQKLVLVSKRNLLSFYVDCGFSVVQKSTIVHGEDPWYDLELDLSVHKVTGCSYCIVDSFANVDALGSGNPAAVVMLQQADVDPTDPDLLAWMMVVAKEFNLSETAFVWQHAEHKQGNELHWNIRYFTPTLEVDLCGHATLAAAGILYRTLSVKTTNDTSIVFHAKQDVLSTQLPSGGLRSVKRRPATKIAMKFPSKPPVEMTDPEAVNAVQKMLWEALKLPSDVLIFLGLSDTGDVLVELTPDAFEAVGYEGLQLDAFKEWDGYARGIVICCVTRAAEKAEGDDMASTGTATSMLTDADVESLDFLSRFFAPKVGISEDPATGSAHCALGPYYSKKLGKEIVVGKQMSERGGIVECRIEEGDDSSVTITGIAVQTMTGNLLL